MIATCAVLSGSAHMRDGKELIQNEGRDEKEKEEEEEVVEGISR